MPGLRDERVDADAQRVPAAVSAVPRGPLPSMNPFHQVDPTPASGLR
jgi:hypothetical protein